MLAASDLAPAGIGLLIRRERMWRGLSASDLAHQAGLSPSYLSKIESGKANPSLKVIAEIARALGVSPQGLLEAPAAPAAAPPVARNRRLRPTVVRCTERKTMRPGNTPVTYELLTPDLQRNLQFILVRHLPGEPTQVFSHEGEESILCLEGRARMVVGDQEFILEPGDAISFDSTIPHWATAAGNEPVVLV